MRLRAHRDEPPPLADLRRHLVESRLAGAVATSPLETITNCRKLVAGDPGYTFGLADWRDAGLLDALAAVRAVCGGDPGGAADLEADGWIDPDATVWAVVRHRDQLAELADHGGGRVLLATGHPTGLLPHYASIARALQQHGCALLTPLDDTWFDPGDSGRPEGIRFLDGVACLTDGAALLHSHHSHYMEAMLDEVGGGDEIDLVIGDHGMAGAAIARGIPTLSIADVNDPALPLAQVRGRTDAVLPIDDNLAPREFVPVTGAMLDWA